MIGSGNQTTTVCSDNTPKQNGGQHYSHLITLYMCQVFGVEESTFQTVHQMEVPSHTERSNVGFSI